MKELFNRINWKNVALFLLFFAMATLVWYEHAMQSVRTTRVPVYIEYTKPGAVGLAPQGLPDHIMIEISDDGANLDIYHREPLHLTIDLQPYIHGNEGVIQIPSNVIRSSISALLQGTSHLLTTDPEVISCPYFFEEEKSVPILFDHDITLAPNFQFLETPAISHSSVILYGKAEDLNAIDTVHTERLVSRDLDHDIHHMQALKIPYGMRANMDSVIVSAKLEEFTEKRLVLPIQIDNVPKDRTIQLLDYSTVEVSAYIGMSHFEEVTEEQFRIVCKYDTLYSDSTLPLRLEWDQNPYIHDAWLHHSSVKCHIVKQ